MNQTMYHDKYDDRFMLYLLSHIIDLGAMSIRRIMRAISPLELVLYIEETQIAQMANLNDKQVTGLREIKDHVAETYEDYQALLASDIRFTTILDDGYPPKLLDQPDSPVVLFNRGSLPDCDIPSVAIVGSRAATSYGSNMAAYFAEELSNAGVQIISGMALGVDGAAHRGAIKGGTKTYAVLGGGVNICYPKQNSDIYDCLCNPDNGGIISEIVPGISPLSRNFPMRNRIISALSDAVIVIEAREKSGSLITADIALNQGKDIFALPGRITDPLSSGCNNLIAAGSEMLRSPGDVLKYLGIIRHWRDPVPEKNIKKLAKTEKIVYSTLDLSPKYIQDIINETKLPNQVVLSSLLSLELKGYISQISANYYGII